MLDIFSDIVQRPCPKCGAEHSLDVAVNQYRIVCRSCRSYLIDPFAVGPWSKKVRVLDTFDGDMASLYLMDSSGPSEAREPDENILAFYKFLRERDKV